MGRKILYTEYAAGIYKAMKEDANDDDEWKGSLVVLRESVSLTRPQFDKAWRFLKDSGAIEVLKLGNRYDPSRILLGSAPKNSQDFLLTERRPSGTLAQQVSDLARLIGGVNLIELEVRVAHLERKLNNTRGEIT